MKRILLPLLLLALPASTAALAAAADEAQNPVESFLEEARISYVLEAREKEIVNRHDNGAFLFENEYRYEMTKTRNVSLEKAAFGETSTASHVVRDEQGRPAQEYLSYDNKVSTYALSNTSYDIDYGNPFVYVAPSDFEEIAEGVYKLDDLKAYEFAYRLLRLDYPLKDVLFNFEDGTFKNITISTPAFEGVTQDQYTYEYMLIDYSYETEVRLSELGTAVVEDVKTAESRDPEHEEALRAALTSLPDSFTVVISEHDRDYEANHEYDAYMYYDGEAIFHQLTLGSLTSGMNGPTASSISRTMTPTPGNGSITTPSPAVPTTPFPRHTTTSCRASRTSRRNSSPTTRRMTSTSATTSMPSASWGTRFPREPAISPTSRRGKPTKRPSSSKATAASIR